jgi:alpha-1,6-mannosyltransferase
MRILDFNNSYSPTGGGIRIYHEHKLEYFASRGHEIALAAPGASPGVEHRGKATMYWLESLPMLRSGYRISVRRELLAPVMESFRPDIVEIGSPYLMPDFAREAIGSSGVPTVGFFHTDYAECYVRPGVSKLLGRGAGDRAAAWAWRRVERTFSWMSAIFGASRSVLGRLHEAGLRRLLLTPLGVDTELFSPAGRSEEIRRSLGVTGRRKLVLFLARLHPEKGLSRLMEAYPLFRDPSRIVLAIGGRGPWEWKVKEFIREFPEVRRVPYMHGRTEVAGLLASADVYLSLGEAETFGLAALEAISSGTVTLLPDASAAGDMARDFDLQPYPLSNPAALAGAVDQALGTVGPDRSAGLRSRVLNGYGWDSSFARIERGYDMLIRAAASGNPESASPEGGWWVP